jgi:hypothetical protein
MEMEQVHEIWLTARRSCREGRRVGDCSHGVGLWFAEGRKRFGRSATGSISGRRRVGVLECRQMRAGSDDGGLWKAYVQQRRQWKQGLCRAEMDGTVGGPESDGDEQSRQEGEDDGG